MTSIILSSSVPEKVVGKIADQLRDQHNLKIGIRNPNPEMQIIEIGEEKPQNLEDALMENAAGVHQLSLALMEAYER